MPADSTGLLFGGWQARPRKHKSGCTATTVPLFGDDLKRDTFMRVSTHLRLQYVAGRERICGNEVLGGAAIRQASEASASGSRVIGERREGISR